MSISLAFGISLEDIESVLYVNENKIKVKNFRSLPELAEQVMAGLSDADHGRIERVALDSGDELCSQTTGAYKELKSILIERGILRG